MGYLISSIPAFPFLIILPILISSLCFQIASADTNLKSICSSTNTTKSITFANNLNNLWTYLKNMTSLDHCFRKQSFGKDGNQVYGLALCRGDVTSRDYHDCLSAAQIGITTQCPNTTRAIYWREYCHVKYSDLNFFGEIDAVNNFTMVNPDIINTPQFGDNVIGLLRNLTQNATKDTTGYMFANGKTGDPAIFGMVQCTQDLSLKNCTTCLEGLLNELNNTYIGTYSSPEGWRTETGSCKVRYEIYDFIEHN